MKYWILSFCFLASLCAKEEVDFLFYLQDAGETNGLLPVIEHLEERGFRIAVLAAGAAQDLTMGREVWTFPDFGGPEVSKSWERTQTLDAATLMGLKNEIEPKAVVAGVAYESQGQVLDLYEGTPTFAFWDNFNSDGENPYFRTARSVAPRASVLLLPTSRIAGDFPGEKRIVGQPTIETWRRQIQKQSEARTALFIGGYGKDYEESFLLFIKCAELAREWNFIVHLHPKTDGSFEAGEIGKKPGLPIRIASKGVSAIEAVGKAEVVLCHQSTVGFQALACGKPVIHLLPAGQTFESLPLKMGLAQRVVYPDEFVEVLQTAAAPTKEEFDALMGIPPGSAERAANALTEAIK